MNLTDEQINSSAMFLPYARPRTTDYEALPCIVLAGDEDGNEGVQVYAYASDGKVIVSVHYDTAGPDEDGDGAWAYYGPQHQVPTVVKAGDADPVWQATAEANPGAETIAQAVLAAYKRGWNDRGVFRVPNLTDAELDDVARRRIQEDLDAGGNRR